MNKLDIKERNHTWHWSSTENRSKFARYQRFLNGTLGTYYKTDKIWTRSVRRVKK